MYTYIYIYIYLFSHMCACMCICYIYKYTLPHMDPWNVNPHFTGQILHNKAHFGS